MKENRNTHSIKLQSNKTMKLVRNINAIEFLLLVSPGFISILNLELELYFLQIMWSIYLVALLSYFLFPLELN